MPDANASQRRMEATIDLGILERLSEEMAEDFAAVMEAILGEVGDSLRKLGNDIQTLPQRELSKLSRGLISLCGNMGAMRLKGMASDLEQAAAHGFPHDPGPRVVAMQREFESVRRFLKEYGY
jgi:predicted nuclease of restriction endonuclease-like RecB superfamily